MAVVAHDEANRQAMARNDEAERESWLDSGEATCIIVLNHLISELIVLNHLISELQITAGVPHDEANWQAMARKDEAERATWSAC